MYEGLKKPKNLLEYKLSRGVTDFGQLAQFNNYETGLSFLIVTQVPRFLELLAKKNETYNTLLQNYIHILEYDFRGIDGLDDLTSDNLTITNGIDDINVIKSVKEQSAAQIQMRVFERSGSTITKLNKLFLTGIRDSRTQVKHYHGLIKSGDLEDGFENEVWTFLYGVTDNTFRNLEMSYLFVAAQQTKADTSIYESEKGTIDNKELTLEFNCFPITGDAVNARAKAALDWLVSDENPDKIVLDSTDFNYTGIDSIPIE